MCSNTVYANTKNFEQTIKELVFAPINNHSDTEYSIDKQGCTWLKITVSKELLNKPLILQFPTIHVNNYCIYVKQKNKWLKIKKNSDLEGGEISPQFQENHFITDQQTIYLKSKDPYVHYGDFVLVERGEYRSIMLSTMVKIEVFYSFFLLSIAITLILYSLFKEKVLLIYCVYIISVFVIYLVEDGLFYFLSNGQCNELLILAILMPVSCLVFVLFMYHFLEIEKLPTKLKYFYLSQVLLYIVLSILLYKTNNTVYFIALVNCTLISTLITLALVLKYFKKDMPARVLAYTFSIVAITSMTYYYSIFPGNPFLFFIIKDKIRIIYSLAFLVASCTLWIKAKKLKTDHESLKAAFESLKANQVQKELINKDIEPVYYFDNKLEISKVIEDLIREKYQCTDREIDVINGIWNGLTNQEISEKLCITLSTTKQHASNVYMKLNVKNRAQVMMLKDTILQQVVQNKTD
ncbi:MAG: LuxR C-terminal-related transcriptional regulator [Flavobacteriaceae bacterium]|jgi:DNA-binding CsgD family transcriptional regulator|nr:LuxR C-terminal-related transcriptional regulator [Flavobacteriaceae bacterium]